MRFDLDHKIIFLIITGLMYNEEYLDNKKLEIINYINEKYNERVPRPLRTLVKRKIKKIETIQLDELPLSLRKCTVEELVIIVQEGMKQGKVKL